MRSVDTRNETRRATGSTDRRPRLGPWLRWFVRHGAARLVLRAGARLGSPFARVMYNPGGRVDPFPLYRDLRERGQVTGNALAMTAAGYDGVEEVLRNPSFTASPASSAVARWALAVTHDAEAVGPLDPPSLFVVDPPEHTRYRRLVSKAVTARAIEGMRPRVHAIVDEALDDLAARQEADPDGEIDLVQAFCKQVPVAAIADLIGVAPDMLGQFLEWSDRAARSLDLGLSRAEFDEADGAVRETNAWLTNRFAQLRENPEDTVLGRLVNLSEDGKKLNDAELLATVQSLLAAGFVTLVDLFSSGVVLLLRHPEQLAALRAHPEGWPNALEEILRIESPVQFTARFAGVDLPVSGCPVKKGRAVVAMIGGANRDERRFADPDRFDVARANANEHLAFSKGMHFCLGSGLARMEGVIGLQALTERFPDLALAGEPVRRGGALLRGYRSVPVRLGRPLTSPDPV